MGKQVVAIALLTDSQWTTIPPGALIKKAKILKEMLVLSSSSSSSTTAPAEDTVANNKKLFTLDFYNSSILPSLTQRPQANRPHPNVNRHGHSRFLPYPLPIHTNTDYLQKKQNNPSK